MHIIELKIKHFLDNLGEYKVPQELINKFGNETTSALIKQFERTKEPFRLRMSNIGRPACQLLFEQNGATSNTNIVRNLYGDICEDILLFLLYASGITVVSEQGSVSVSIEGINLKGTYDIILDLGDGPSVWDIKSASDWAFKYKYRSFEEVADHDTFGYVAQLFLYARGLGIRPGGWIIIDKSSGSIRVIEAPVSEDGIRGDRAKSIFEEVSNTIKILSKQTSLLPQHGRIDHVEKSVYRAFQDQPEKFNRRETGNRTLNDSCYLCDHKFECWPGLQYKPRARSQSKSPPMVYYTEFHEEQDEIRKK